MLPYPDMFYTLPAIVVGGLCGTATGDHSDTHRPLAKEFELEEQQIHCPRDDTYPVINGFIRSNM